MPTWHKPKPRANRGLGQETLVGSNTCSDAAMLKTACNGKQEKRTFERKWGRTRLLCVRKIANRREKVGVAQKKTQTCLGHPAVRGPHHHARSYPGKGGQITTRLFDPPWEPPTALPRMVIDLDVDNVAKVLLRIGINQ